MNKQRAQSKPKLKDLPYIIALYHITSSYMYTNIHEAWIVCVCASLRVYIFEYCALCKRKKIVPTNPHIMGMHAVKYTIFRIFPFAAPRAFHFVLEHFSYCDSNIVCVWAEWANQMQICRHRFRNFICIFILVAIQTNTHTERETHTSAHDCHHPCNCYSQSRICVHIFLTASMRVKRSKFYKIVHKAYAE